MVTRRKPTKKIVCSVCRHPERRRIEMLRLAGSSADVLADHFGLGRDAIYRHHARHVSKETKAALMADVPLKELADRAAEAGVSLLDHFAIVRSTLMTQMLGAASVGDRSGTANLAGKAIDVLDKIGRLTGEMLNASSITNITNNNAFFLSPDFNRLERMLLERLVPFPDALQAVMAGLDELEGTEHAPTPMKAVAPILEGSLVEA